VLAAITEGRLKTRRIVIDPFLILGDEGLPFNPIAALNPDSYDFVDDAMLMAESMITLGEKEPHWGQAAQDFLSGFIMYVRLKYGRDGSMVDVRKLVTLDQANMVKAVKDMIRTAEIHGCDALTAKVTRLLDWTSENREISGVMATAIAQTRWIDSPLISACMGGDNTIDFASLKDEPTTVFLVLPPARLRTHAMWMRLMLASILQPLMKDTRADTVPVLLMLDEFYAIAKGGLPVIDDNMAMLREYGIKLWVVLQDLAQAHMLYGEHGWQSYIANSGVFQSFATNDVITSKFVSDLSGEFFMKVKGTSGTIQYTPDGQMTESTGSSVNPTRMPVILPEHARNMDDGYSIVFMNEEKGHRFTYLPYPTLIPWTAAAMASDPSAATASSRKQEAPASA